MDDFNGIVELLTLVSGAVIAFFLYRLDAASRKDNWVKTLRDFHQFFWTDDDLKDVRQWIANDMDYEDIRDVLRLRNEKKSVSSDKYNTLEKIDKFAALLLAYKRVMPRDLGHDDLLKRLFDDYWLGSITKEKRPELREYICTFYGDLEGGLGK